MNRYVALLRGINVGGHGRLPMARLREICQGLGFARVRTYIQSGNVLFQSAASEAEIIRSLEAALLALMGRPIPVILRKAEELAGVLAANPFPLAEPSRVGVIFFAEPLPRDLPDRLPLSGPEEVRLVAREIYVHYPQGMGRSKLKPPPGGTTRNLNSLAKLVELVRSA